MHNYGAGFCVHKPAWHKLDNTLQKPPDDLDEALTFAFPRRDGQPGYWEPEPQPVFDRQVQPDGSVIYVAIEDWYQVKRDDDSTVRLSVPRSTWSLIGNRTTFELVEILAGQGAEWDTGGSLGDGGQVFATMVIPEPLEVAGDNSASYPFMSIVNGHDGSSACRVGFGSHRVVCANTYMFQEQLWDQGVMPSFTFRHTANVQERIDEAKQVLGAARMAFTAFVELSEELAKLPCLDEQLTDFLSEFIPEPAADVITERQRNNIAGARGKVRALYESSVTTEAHRGSALGLVEASIEYLDHYRAHRTQETLVRRTLIDTGTLKGKVIELAREVCSN